MHITVNFEMYISQIKKLITSLFSSREFHVPVFVILFYESFKALKKYCFVLLLSSEIAAYCNWNRGRGE